MAKKSTNTQKVAPAPAVAKKTIADNTAAKAPKTVAERIDRTKRQVKLAAGHAKRNVMAAGTKAAAHVSRNKAAYIAGGLGAAAGAVGGATMSRKRQSQGEN
jgi:hypothetical protein